MQLEAAAIYNLTLKNMSDIEKNDFELQAITPDLTEGVVSNLQGRDPALLFNYLKDLAEVVGEAIYRDPDIATQEIELPDYIDPARLQIPQAFRWRDREVYLEEDFIVDGGTRVFLARDSGDHKLYAFVNSEWYFIAVPTVGW